MKIKCRPEDWMINLPSEGFFYSIRWRIVRIQIPSVDLTELRRTPDAELHKQPGPVHHTGGHRNGSGWAQHFPLHYYSSSRLFIISFCFPNICLFFYLYLFPWFLIFFCSFHCKFFSQNVTFFLTCPAFRIFRFICKKCDLEAKRSRSSCSCFSDEPLLYYRKI